MSVPGSTRGRSRNFSNTSAGLGKSRSRAFSVLSAFGRKHTFDEVETFGKPCQFVFLQNNLNLRNNDQVAKVYEVDDSKELGAGAFGSVFIATHKKTGERRAIKQIIKKRFTPKEEKKLANEMEILQDLAHPNILRIVEFFETKNRVLVVTDLYEGGELFDEIKLRREFDEHDAAIVITQLLSCISYINRKFIVHRDIKPENIMLEKNKDLYTLKLIDFGNARTFNPVKDGFMSDMQGTPYYMAPEVIHKHYNEKCDIWSIGVVTYILLCGRPPFFGQNNALIYKRITAGKFSMNFKPWEGVSDTAKAFVTWLLTLDIDDRPTAAQALEHKFIKKVHAKPGTLAKFANKFSGSLVISADVTLPSSGTDSDDKTKMKKNRNRDLKADEIKQKTSAVCQNLKNFQCRKRLVQVVYNYVLNHFLTKAKREEMAMIFKEFDVDHDGVLTKEEIRNGLRKYNRKAFSNVDINFLFNVIDNDGNGEVDYQEFMLAAADEGSLMNEAILNSVFDMIDEDRDQKITLPELRNLMNKKDDVPEADLMIMLEEAGCSNGSITREEFLALTIYRTD